MEALPDVEALAACPEDRYLKLWEGLGYYNRVRNLHAAAEQIMEQYGGTIPDTVEELLRLKGIGSYTAGAIASIAYNRPVPAVDGNVLRVISRVCADDSDIMKQSVRSAMERSLQAMMETEVTNGLIPRKLTRTDGVRRNGVCAESLPLDSTMPLWFKKNRSRRYSSAVKRQSCPSLVTTALTVSTLSPSISTTAWLFPQRRRTLRIREISSRGRNGLLT